MGFAAVVPVAERVVEEALAVGLVLLAPDFVTHFAGQMMTLKQLAAGFAAHFELGLEAEVLEVAEGAEVQKD